MDPLYTYGHKARPFRQIVWGLCLAALVALVYSRNLPQPPSADAGVIQSRQSDSDICTRWAQQSAVVNGTLFLYGGRASTQPGQTDNTWNNDFLSLDLTKTWQISSPSLSSLPQPSGPPPVSEGTLWSSLTSLFLYGGEFSSSPSVAPQPFALWEYDVPASSWTSYPTPSATAGPNAPDGGPVQRAAEGAGASAAGLGRAWYFGGHLDGYTTVGWDAQTVPRVYLKSLLEFTFPGGSSPDGGFRNVTEGGLQDSSGFPERADGVLVYVPNIGKQGILVGLAGGTNNTFTQLNVVDIYDIDSSTWYKQSTAGPTPPIRVNPCAVAAVAADGSSVNIHVFGGQNLQPAGAQTQFDDMWILTLPSFTWIQVDMSNQAVPPARAGHTCNIWDGQMVVVGGYVGAELSCDSPGVYVFNLSSLTWGQSFTSLSDPQSNPLAKQSAQESDPNALPGCYGYDVPTVVQHNVGGGPSGGATVTVPVASATSGPLATGTPKTYDVPGVTTTATAAAKPSSGLSTGGEVAIAVGIVAGLLFVVAVYLAICAWLYRKRMRTYQWNMERARTQLTNERMSTNMHPNAHGYFGDGPSPESGLTGSSGASGGEYGDIVVTDFDGKEKRQKSSDDLLKDQEPTFVGIMLHPRRSLRVVNV